MQAVASDPPASGGRGRDRSREGFSDRWGKVPIAPQLPAVGVLVWGRDDGAVGRSRQRMRRCCTLHEGCCEQLGCSCVQHRICSADIRGMLRATRTVLRATGPLHERIRSLLLARGSQSHGAAFTWARAERRVARNSEHVARETGEVAGNRRVLRARWSVLRARPPLSTRWQGDRSNRSAVSRARTPVRDGGRKE